MKLNKIKFSKCNLMVTIWMRRWVNNRFNYEIGLLYENKINARGIGP